MVPTGEEVWSQQGRRCGPNRGGGVVPTGEEVWSQQGRKCGPNKGGGVVPTGKEVWQRLLLFLFFLPAVPSVI